MSDAARIQGVWRNVTDRYIRIGGVWRKVSGVAVRVGGAWRPTPGSTQAFSASAPASTYGYQDSPNNKPVAVSSPSVTITVNGGVAPYTYQWVFVSGSTRISAATPNSAFTRFTAQLRGEIISANFGWTARDANGSTASGSIQVQLEAGDNR